MVSTLANSELFNQTHHNHQHHHCHTVQRCHVPHEQNCGCAEEGLLPSSYLHGAPCFSDLVRHKECRIRIVQNNYEPLFKRLKKKCHKNH